MTDVSYFGTLMVHLGLADGMVSGAAHTTAHTIRPGVRDHQDQAGRVGGLVGVPHGARRPRARLRRLRRHPRSDVRAARRHRDLVGRDGRPVRNRPAHRDAVVLDGRVGVGRRGREGARGDRARARARARAARRGPDPVRRRRRCRGRRSEDARIRRWPAARRCSSSPTSTPATTPTRRCSARREPSRSARCCRASTSRSTTSRAAHSSTTSSTPSRSPRSRRRAQAERMSVVLVVNSGSSSFKYQLIDMDAESVLASGLVERIGEDVGVVEAHGVASQRSASGDSGVAAFARRDLHARAADPRPHGRVRRHARRVRRERALARRSSRPSRSATGSCTAAPASSSRR